MPACVPGTPFKADRFRIDQRSFQRDIDELRAYFAERNMQDGPNIQTVYDWRRKSFVLWGHKYFLMSNSEILAVSKILLGSRGVSKKDMSAILDKLLSGCSPQKNMKLVAGLLANEKTTIPVR